MTEFDLAVDEDPDEADIARIAQGVTAHGRQRAQSDAKPLACWARAEGQLLAGACGRTEFGRLFVSSLWVAEHLRRRGLGSQLLDRMEQAAFERGCKDALIETLLEEVALMYRRRGYEPLAVIPAYVGSFTRHVLLKQLVHSAQCTRSSTVRPTR